MSDVGFGNILISKVSSLMPTKSSNLVEKTGRIIAEPEKGEVNQVAPPFTLNLIFLHLKPLN